MLARAQAPDVALVGIECVDEDGEQAESPQNAKQGFETRAAFAGLQPRDRSRRHSRAIGELRLGDPPEASPGAEVSRGLAQCASNWWRRRPRATRWGRRRAFGSHS